MIALVRSGFQHFNPQVFLDFLCDLGQQTMVCRMVRHLKPGYQVALCINRSLGVISDPEAVVLFHQLCIRVSERHLAFAGLFQFLQVTFVPCLPLLEFRELLFQLFTAQFAAIILSVAFLQCCQVLINV